MPEIQSQIKKLIKPFFPNFYVFLVSILNRFLIFLQLREKLAFWGVVYDSVTKQPLDPVKVSMVYVDGSKIEGSNITDLEGRFGFLARPGQFKILAQRTNYIFPSNLVRGNTDGIYTHLYHGEFFELKNDSEVVAPNIPMDPVGEDWNQKAKRQIVVKRIYLRLLMERLQGILFWFGFIYASIMLIASRFQAKGFQIVILAYLAVFILEIFLPRQRLWGIVKEFKSKMPIEELEFKLTMPSLPGIVFGTSRTREDGKFFLRANPGKYILHAIDPSKNEELGSISVTVHKDGVLNKTLLVKL